MESLETLDDEDKLLLASLYGECSLLFPIKETRPKDVTSTTTLQTKKSDENLSESTLSPSVDQAADISFVMLSSDGKCSEDNSSATEEREVDDSSEVSQLKKCHDISSREDSAEDQLEDDEYEESFINDDENEMEMDSSVNTDSDSFDSGQQCEPTEVAIHSFSNSAAASCKGEKRPLCIVASRFPSQYQKRSSSESSCGESGEESFEKYLRRLRKENEKKRQKGGKLLVFSDEENGEESTRPPSDHNFIVPDDEEEDSSEEEEDEETQFDSPQIGSSNKERLNKGMKTLEKNNNAVRKESAVLASLTQSFKSPSLHCHKMENDDPYHFLCSLSESFNRNPRHRDAQEFLRPKALKAKGVFEKLVSRIYSIYRSECFDDLLPSSMSISLNPRLLTSAGLCRSRHGVCSIELSSKVCTNPERIRDTLAHEMCHAAVFLINLSKVDKHGPLWQAWARLCDSRFKQLPLVCSRCHNYKIEKKFVYECDGCGQTVKRHSKSFETARRICGLCHGNFVLRTNGSARVPSAFACFVRDTYAEEKKTGASHKLIMQTLSARFKTKKLHSAAGEVTPEKKGSGKNDMERGERSEEEGAALDMSVLSIHG